MFQNRFLKIIQFLVFILPLIILVSFYFWAQSNGSSFQAAVIRGLTQTRIAFSSMPKPSVLLPVKFDKQDHKLSCEVAVLKMALAYRGVKVDEKELIEKIGVDSTPRQEKNNQLIWGNPNKAFVGNIDGKMLAEGYGVHWYPIGRIANQYRHTFVFQNWDAGDIVEELSAGNPVVIWGYLGSGKPVEWKTPDGKTIKSVYYEHTFVVNGYTGTSQQPTGFHLIDPIYGYRYYSKDAFLKMWNAFGRSGVVVY